MNVKSGSFVQISFVSPSEMKKLNKKYRGKNYATDVLSFNIGERLPDGRHYLGDIVINLSKAKEQAKDLNHSLEEEISFLAGHGMLHLMGIHHD